MAMGSNIDNRHLRSGAADEGRSVNSQCLTPRLNLHNAGSRTPPPRHRHTLTVDWKLRDHGGWLEWMGCWAWPSSVLKAKESLPCVGIQYNAPFSVNNGDRLGTIQPQIRVYCLC